jgi:predicted transposase/invertase (TIGR01784 family)
LGKIKRIPYKGLELLPAKADLVFKALMTADGDLELLASLLSSILEMDLHAADISVANTELPATHEDGKVSRVDVRVTLGDGKHINAEVQVGDEHNMEKRSVFYISRLYTDQMKPQMKFADICPAIAINILDFPFLPFSEYHNRYRLKNTENSHELTDVFEINFLELPKVPEEDLKSLKDLWMRFFTANDEETLEMLKNRNPIFRRAVDKLVYFSADEQLRYDLDMREKWELDHGSMMAASVKKGRQEGIEQGIEENKRKTVIEMKKRDFPEDVIADIVKLPVERVREIV